MVGTWSAEINLRLQQTEKRLIRSIRQYGGTAQISRGEAIVREYARGEDKRGLGRWVW